MFRKFLLRFRTKILSLLYLRKAAAHGTNCRVNGVSKFTKNTYIHNDCHFNGLEILGRGKVEIYDHFHSGKNCIFITSFHDYDNGNALPYGRTYVDKDIIIHKNVWIGIGVKILGGAEIGEGAIIQAGSVVTGNIPPLAIAGGHPAKVFKMRSEAHYWELEAKQKDDSLSVIRLESKGDV